MCDKIICHIESFSSAIDEDLYAKIADRRRFLMVDAVTAKIVLLLTVVRRGRMPMPQ